MKKDILAVITFLTTGVLFYLIQVGGPNAQSVTSIEEGGFSEEVLMEDRETENPTGLILREEGARDS